MKTIKSLTKNKNSVYFHLRNKEICRRFFENAEAEGIIFSDGMKPTQKQSDDIIRLLHDGTICYVGYLGRIYCKSSKCIYIDYEKTLKIRGK